MLWVTGADFVVEDISGWYDIIGLVFPGDKGNPPVHQKSKRVVNEEFDL